jgi:hypothetical protein
MFMIRFNGCSFFFCFFLMADEMNYLAFVLTCEITTKRDDAGWKFVVNAAGGRARFLGHTSGSRHPLPAPVSIDGTTLQTDRILTQFFLALVGVENVILLGASPRCGAPSVAAH